MKIQAALDACKNFFMWLWQGISGCFQNKIALIAALLLVPFVLFFLCNFFWNLLQGLKNLFAPTVCVPAKIMLRREEQEKNRWRQLICKHRFVGPAFEYERTGCTKYFVQFQLADGSKKELQVWREIYMGIQEGDYGILSFRGDRFKSFRMSTMNAQKV